MSRCRLAALDWADARRSPRCAVANRIVTVGDLGRAERLAQHFDDKTKVSVVKSSRGFVTFTGTFNRVRRR